MGDIVKGSRVMRNFSRYQSRHDAGEVITDPVKDPLNQGLKAYVKFDSWSTHPMEVYLSALILEEEGLAKSSKLEEEFKKVQVEVDEKMQEAAEKIKEARELAQSTGLEVSSIISDYHTFIDEVSSAGWNTSSWSC